MRRMTGRSHFFYTPLTSLKTALYSRLAGAGAGYPSERVTTPLGVVACVCFSGLHRSVSQISLSGHTALAIGMSAHVVV